MAQPILVPQVGQDLTEAKVVELHVKLGDRVKKGDLVAVVESEKASFEVEAFAEGVVLDLPYKEGDLAEVLTPLMTLGDPVEAGEAGSDADETTVETPAEAGEEVPPSQLEPAQVTGTAASIMSAASALTRGLRASPLARRVAGTKGIDLKALAGTGPAGAVVLRDVEAAVAAPAGVVEMIASAQASAGAASPTLLELRTLQAGQGLPVVFLHGFGGDLSAWRPLVGGIGLGSPMLALDLPGHGGSADRDAGSFADLVETVGQALRGLHGGLHLVGHSLGAAVAAALTQRGDLDVRSLTLIAPAGLGPSIDGAFIKGFLAAKSEAALAAWMRRLVHDPARLTLTLVRATLEARESGSLAESQARLARGLFEGSTQLFSVRDALRRYDGPLTVIVGREDAIIPPKETDGQLPGHAALHRLEQVGHLPQVEATQIVQKIIARTMRAVG